MEMFPNYTISAPPTVTASSPKAASPAAGSSHSGPWYALHPLPTFQPAVGVYNFINKDVEKLVFTHASAVSGAPEPSNSWFRAPGTGFPGSAPQRDNSVLAWHGDLRAALTHKALHAHFTRILGIDQRLNLVPDASNTKPTDRTLSDLFDAYVGGIWSDGGVNSISSSYEWYGKLIAPCLDYYYEKYRLFGHNHRDNNSAPPSTASAEAKARRQTVAGFTSKLMEFAAKNKLEPPKFEFSDNGLQGAGIQWKAIIILGGRAVATGTASTKLEAKHLASKEALAALNVTEDMDQPSERRKKKQDRRKMQKHAQMASVRYTPGVATPTMQMSAHQPPPPMSMVPPPGLQQPIPTSFGQPPFAQHAQASRPPQMSMQIPAHLPPRPPV